MVDATVHVGGLDGIGTLIDDEVRVVFPIPVIDDLMRA